MHIAVPRETAPGERRVALLPADVAKLAKLGHQIAVETQAGSQSSSIDSDYAKAGARIGADFADTVRDAQVICAVQPPALADLAAIPTGATVIAYLQPATSRPSIDALNARRASALALELVPRITRAQSMDVLSSQATISGYRSVLLGAEALDRLMPMLSTAAGTLAPAKCFVLGAGVAGLQAIATARRLGALVSGFDVRPAAREQILSLGATVLKVEGIDAEGSGGYAREQDAEQAARTQAAIRAHVATMDLVITTAAIPGKRAPVLLTAESIAGMKEGAVIVDLAAETGGNCEGTRAGETVRVGGVRILGPTNVPSQAAAHASQLLSKNVLTLLQHLTKESALHIDPADEITGAMLVCHQGELRV
ncbi:MAG: NAD(P) transhydrogenase subunit alpha [Gemmatimonadaceae bacterium]|nr:NAD(P) transhydrogenase subunit alpha [Gemmatimonadaceae bacterium]